MDKETTLDMDILGMLITKLSSVLSHIFYHQTPYQTCQVPSRPFCERAATARRAINLYFHWHATSIWSFIFFHSLLFIIAMLTIDKVSFHERNVNLSFTAFTHMIEVLPCFISFKPKCVCPFLSSSKDCWLFLWHEAFCLPLWIPHHKYTVLLKTTYSERERIAKIYTWICPVG